MMHVVPGTTEEVQVEEAAKIAEPVKWLVRARAPSGHVYCSGAISTVFKQVFRLAGAELYEALQLLDTKAMVVLKSGITRDVAEHYVAVATTALLARVGGCDCRTNRVVSFKAEEE